MPSLASESLSLKQALLLGLAMLCIYYPITIYVNLPLEHWSDVSLMAIYPAFVNFGFYTFLALAIDRIINHSERWIGPRMLEWQVGTIALSIGVAVLAVVLSQILFRVNFKAWSLLSEWMGQADLRPGGLRPPQLWNGLRRTSNSLTVALSISIFYLLLNRKANARLRALERQAEQLKKEHAVAQLDALRNQVSPHFLFNSLSILSSLVHTDARLSEQFIDQLSKVYRYVLENKENDTVLLQTELDFLQSYSFLLKIRFENKFDVKVMLTEAEGAQWKIAPLTLQLLMENAVKHNRMSAEEPLLVHIALEASYLVISNKRRPRLEPSAPISTGVGLANISQRYRLLSERPVRIEQNEDWFTIKIPLLS